MPGGDKQLELGDYGWYGVNAGLQTHPVGQKKPNQWGLFDMYGNVWEWVHDWYAPYGGGDTKDPEGPASGNNKSLRGGAWLVSAVACSSAVRNPNDPPVAGAADMGFRVALR